MADEQVLIKYTDSSLAAKFGCAPFKTSLHLALQYEAKGIAVILNRPPSANPSPSPKKLQEEQKKQEAAFMAEQELLTKVAWLTSTYVDRTLLKVGEKSGYRVEVNTPTAFSIHRILTANLLIVESKLHGFSHNQLTDLRAAQFQKEKPFVFRVIQYETSDSFKQNLMRAKLVIFATERLLSNAQELYGDLFLNYFVEQEDGWYSMWSEIDRILKPPNVGRSTNILEERPLDILNDPRPHVVEGDGQISLQDLKDVEKRLPPIGQKPFFIDRPIDHLIEPKEDFFGELKLPPEFDASKDAITGEPIDVQKTAPETTEEDDDDWLNEIVESTTGKKQ